MEALTWPDDERPVAPVVEQVAVACLADSAASRRYNEEFTSLLRGEVDDMALESSLQALVDRHEALRQSYHLSPDSMGLTCRLHPAGSVRMAVRFAALPHCSSPADEEVQDVLDQAAKQLIPLATPPLMHATVVHLAGGTLHVLCFIANHIVLDTPSFALLAQDLAALYNARVSGSSSQDGAVPAGAPLPPLPFQFADFAAWQLRSLAGELRQQQLDYWRARLAGAPQLLQLPTDRPRPEVATNRGAILSFSVEGDTHSQLLAFMKARRQSPIRVFLAAYVALLSRYSRQRDVVVLLPRAIRPPGTQGLIGHFINVLAVRTGIEEGDTFVGLVLKCAQGIKEAVAQGDVSFQEVIGAVCTTRSRAYTPIAQATITIHEEGWFKPPALAGTAAEELPPDAAPHAGRSIADIALRVRSCSDRVLCHFEYNTDILEESTVRRMAANLQAFLAAAVAAPEVPLDSLPMVSPGEQQLLARFACRELRPHYLAGPLAHQMFEQAAAATPGAPCLLFEGEVLTYQQVNASANQLVHALLREGAQSGSTLGLLMDRSPDYVTAVLAAWKAGCAFVPLDPSYPEDRLAAYVEDATPVLLLAQSRHRLLAEKLRNEAAAEAKVLCVEDCWGSDEVAGHHNANPGLSTSPDALAYILYTSGSTGRPKGVMITHRGLADMIRATVDGLALKPGDIGLLSITCAFDAHLYQMCSIFSGGSLVIAKPQGHTDPAYMAALIRQRDITWVCIVPSLLLPYIEELRPEPCASLRLVISCAEPLPRKLMDLVHGYLPQAQLANVYGPTEVTVMSNWTPINPGTEFVTIGPPDPNMHCYVVQAIEDSVGQDGAATLLPVGAPGELLLSGPRLALGYIKRPDLTAAAFVPNPCYDLVKDSLPEGMRPFYRLAYRTGDLVRWRPDGSIECLGRIDRQVKIDGVRMEVDEIESVLSAAPGVAQAAVAAQTVGAEGRKRLVGYVSPAGVDLEAVKAHCRSKLLPAMVPAVVVALESMPLLPNGKVDRKVLPLPADTEGGSGPEEYVPPQDELEAAIQGVWVDVLGLTEAPSVTSDFFAVGGSSLKAGVIQARVERQDLGLACALPYNMVLDARTIRGMAQGIAALQAEQTVSAGPVGKAAAAAAARVPRQQWHSAMRPLSANQEQMWLLHSIGLGTAYNMQTCASLEGSLDLQALEAAVRSVVERHEVLRLRLFDGPDGSAAGEVLPPEATPCPFAVLDAPSEAPADTKAALESELAAPFDFSRPPYLRALLLRHSPQRWTLALTMHHSVGDAWSYQVLLQDLSGLYNAAAGGGPAAAAAVLELPIQYSDWAAWQRSRVSGQGEGLERERLYWQECLRGCVPLLRLPHDRPRPAEPTYALGTLRMDIAGPLQLARQAAKALKVSLQAVVLAAVQLVLMRLSGQDDVTIGVPTAGRQQLETHALIGYFINPLPIRATPSEAATFADLARQAADALLGAMSNSLLPLQDVVAAAGVPRQAGVSPLFQVISQVLDAQDSVLPAFSGVQAAALPSDCLPQSPQAKMDLILEFDAAGELHVEYMAELFDTGTVQRLADSICTALQHGAAYPDTPIPAVPMVSAAERQLLARFACRELRPHYLAGPLAHQMFEQAAAATPGTPCLVFEGEVLTYQQVNASANQLASALLREGTQSGSAIGLLMDRSPDYVTAVLAAWKAGCAFVPLDPSYPEGRLAAYVEDATPVLLLSQSRHRLLAEKLRDAAAPGAKVQCVEDLQGSAQPAGGSSNPCLEIPPSALAYIIYTSGSTGRSCVTKLDNRLQRLSNPPNTRIVEFRCRPKGVMITHQGLADFFRGTADGLGLKPADVGLLSSTCAFDASIYQLLSIMSGGSLVIAKHLGHTDPAYMAALIRQQGVTWVATVPSLLMLYFEELRPEPCSSVGLVISFGEPLPRKLVDLIHSYLPQARLANVYGPTEVTIATLGGLVGPGSDVITIGYPDPNVHCYVVQAAMASTAQPQDGAATLLPVGAPGELLLSGPRLALGYIKRPDLTAAAFVPNPCYDLMKDSLPEDIRPYYKLAYRTGDLVRWRPDGTIECLGRIDRQVKIDGVRMEVDEIESVLATAPGVALATVAAQAFGADGRKRLVGYVSPAEVDLEAVKAHCRSKLLPAMVPAVVVALESMPLLPNGKVNRRALPLPPDMESGSGPEEYVPPQDEVEAAIQDIWLDVMGLAAPPSVTADFYAMGGSSLQAGVIQARIRQGMQVAGLSGTAVMQHPTIRSLADYVKSLAEQGSSGSGSFLTRGFSQQWLVGRGGATRKLLANARSFRSRRLLAHLSAEDPRLPQRFGSAEGDAVPLLRVPPPRLPYGAYLMLQYLLLVLAQLPATVAWICTVLLLAVCWEATSSYWLLLLWAPIAAAQCLVAAAAAVALTWVLLPWGLQPGVHPLYGWMHARWAAARAAQRSGLRLGAPFIARTPLLPWLYRLLGSKIGSGALLDAGQFQEPQLLSIGDGAQLGRGVLVSGSMVAPAGMVAPYPALILSEVQVGSECQVGHKAVLPAGARLSPGSHLRPRAAPSHAGAVGTGRLRDTPEFKAEEHIEPGLASLCALLSFLAHTLAMLPGLVAAFAIMGCIFGANPFRVLHTNLFQHGNLGPEGDIHWRLVVWPPLFSALFFTVAEPLGAFVHTTLLVAYKRLVLGRLPPGTCLTKSRWLLLRYALYCRLLEEPLHAKFRQLTFSTTLPGALYKWLGAAVGSDVFLGSLSADCHDALCIGSRVSSGGDSHVYTVDAEGTVQAVVIGDGATIGNSAVLYPGCRLQESSLVGNDTVLASGATLGERVRLQGSVQYLVDPGAKDLESVDAGKAAAGPGPAAEGGSSAGLCPAWHMPCMLAAMLLLQPLAPLLRYSTLAFAVMLVVEAAGWAGVAAYVAGIGGGLALATAWLRLLPSLVGMHRRWAEGSAMVFSIAAAAVHSILSNPIYNILLETPFMAWAYRALGFKVGEGAVLMGHLPLERTLVSIASGAVVESAALVEGHYLESLMFNYKPCRVGKGAWVQQGARVMPGVEMGAGARLLPGSTVLPGEVLEAGTLWGGCAPANPQGICKPMASA